MPWNCNYLFLAAHYSGCLYSAFCSSVFSRLAYVYFLDRVRLAIYYYVGAGLGFRRAYYFQNHNILKKSKFIKVFNQQDKMAFKKMDFVELEFTGRLKNGEIFDSNIKEDLEKLHHGHNHPIETKPFVLCLGEHMFLDSIEDFLMGKDIGEYEISLSPEKAFGVRNSK